MKKIIAGVITGVMLTGASYGHHNRYHYSPPITKDNVAVVVVDMQPDFLARIDEQELDRELAYQLQLLHVCATEDAPVYMLEYKGHPKTIPEMRQAVSEVPRYYIVEKAHDNGFFETNLALLLQEESIEYVVLTGVNASFCVKATAKGVAKAGLSMITSDDLIADPRSVRENENISWYQKHGWFFDDYEDVLGLLEEMNDDN